LTQRTKNAIVQQNMAIENDKLKYELGIITISSEASLSIPKILKDFSFSIDKEEEVKHLTLAYKINKFSEGFFSVLYISTENADSIAKLNNALELNKEVLRFIIIKHQDIKPREVRQVIPKSTTDNIKEIKLEAKPKTVDLRKEVLSNEALEKKLEEILK